MPTMKVVVLNKVQDIKIEKREISYPKSNEVLIKVKSVGISGFDFQYYAIGICGTYTFSKPFILDHEASGEITSTGSDVKNIKVGDRVAIEPSPQP